jgi:hypothetical protein
MKLRGATVVAVLGILALPSSLRAQAKPIKDQIVYLKVPHHALQSKTSVWSGTSLSGVIEPSGDGAVVNGEAGWRLAAFPPMTEYKVKKVKAQARSGEMPSGPAEVEVESNTALNIKLTFPKGETAKLFPVIFAARDEIESYRTETYKLLASKFFDGTPLAGLTEPQKLALCTFANVTAKGTKMGSVKYKDNLYLLVDLGFDENIYNDLKLNQPQRVAHVLNERLLTVLKAFALPVADAKDVHGLKLEITIPHRSFLDKTAEPALDKLEIYAPTELIRQFADADITSQQFIDGCVVIVENNRIAVPLASS